MGGSRHVEVGRLLLALAIAGLMLAACGGDDAVEVVEVTGTSTGVQTQDGTMSGPVLPTSGWEGTTLRDSVYLYTNEMSDPRASGEQVTTVNCDFAEDGESVIGDCWGTLVITNAGGTWDGTFAGTTSWSSSEPDHLHVLEATYIGTGDYDGLRLVTHIEGTDYPWTMTGRIEEAT